MMGLAGERGDVRQGRTVRITAPFDPAWLERFERLQPDLRFEHWPVASVGAIPDDSWRDVEILYTSFATRLPPPQQAPQLRWVQLYSAGIDQIAENPLVQSQVLFTTASGIHAPNMAEYVMAVLLAWYHRLPTALEWQGRRQWPSAGERSTIFTGEEARGKTIGIVGYGSIGRQAARLARTFGMRVVAMQRGADHHDRGFSLPGVGDPDGTLPERYFAPDQMHAMLAESDVVLVAVPLTTATRAMIDAAALHAMKPTAFLINIARGDVCDEAALVRALETKQIGGAALDVFGEEPLPPDHPLWQLSNCLISPHMSSLTPLYAERAAMLFEENLRRYLAGDTLYNVVNLPLGY